MMYAHGPRSFICGRSLSDLHLRHDVAARGLLKLGIFVPGSVKGSEDDVVAAIIASGLTTAFYPHGVGHLLYVLLALLS